MSDRLALWLAGAALLFLVGATYAGLNLPQEPRSREFALDMRPKVEGNVVRVEGTTNLPKDARLVVYVDRLYRLRGASIWSAARIGHEELLVDGEKWSVDIVVDDAQWVQEVRKRVDDGEIDPVEAVHDALRVSVYFSPLIPQDPKIHRELGPNFERLFASDQALQAGAHWQLGQQRRVPFSIKPMLKRMLTAQAS